MVLTGVRMMFIRVAKGLKKGHIRNDIMLMKGA